MKTTSPITCIANRPVRIFLLLISLLLFAVDYGHSLASEKKFPFEVGEKLMYRASLGGVAVGTATIEVLPGDRSGKVPSYHFVMKTTTNDRVNWLYRVRELQESYTDREMTRTLAYGKRDTGTHPRNVRVRFDWNRMEATYENDGKKKRTVPLIPGTFDPLSLLFVIRTKHLNTGDVVEIPITNGKNLIRARASVLRKEKIVVDGKSWNTFLVVPDLKQLGKALGRKDAENLMIWFGTGPKKLPVRIVSQFAVGRFVFELIPEKTT